MMVGATLITILKEIKMNQLFTLYTDLIKKNKTMYVLGKNEEIPL